MDTENQNLMLAVILAATAAVIAAERYSKKYLTKMPYRAGAYKGYLETQSIIGVSDNICRSQVRMTRRCFFSLCKLLRDRRLLVDSKYLQVEEQLCMFLNTIGHNHKNRVVGHNFGHSGETVSRYFNMTLNAIVQLYPELMKPPSTAIPDRIANNPHKYLPYFKDCIGAIDGSHIPAWVPSDQHRKFRDRHGNISQNILAACDFNMKLTYILPGWEGSASDSTILDCATHKVGEAKLKVPRGKFYLVDAGFANQLGFLRPYRGVRYHLKEWKNCTESPVNAKELFNLRHSQLRNVIERVFGVLKKRFKILKTQPEYPYKTQVKIVMACVFIHNHILNYNRFVEEEDFLNEEEAQQLVSSVLQNTPQPNEQATIADSDEEDDDNENMEQFRDMMATHMWNDWETGVGSDYDSLDDSM